MKARFLKFLIISFTFLILPSFEAFPLTTKEITLLGRWVNPRRLRQDQRAAQKKKEEAEKKKEETPDKKEEKKSEKATTNKEKDKKSLAYIFLTH